MKCERNHHLARNLLAAVGLATIAWGAYICCKNMKLFAPLFDVDEVDEIEPTEHIQE